MPLLNGANVINWDAYFTRFMVMFWLLIFPCLFFFAFWFLRELNKGNKTIVISPMLSPFYAYGYFFHNLIFAFLSVSMIFNTLLLLYAIFDAYVLGWNSVYQNLWNIERAQAQDQHPEDKHKFLWSVVFLGYIFHTVSFLAYVYHNLYYTDSYFGERWRWLISISTSNRKLLAFKRRYPKIYAFIYPKFLDIELISSRLQKKTIVTLN